jgi:mortality factor 4-like protein 1
VVLPSAPTVNVILDAYLAHLADKGPKVQAVAAEIVAGLKTYFRHAVGTILLYQRERAQYDELLAADPDADVASIYGGVHLLRLFGAP